MVGDTNHTNLNAIPFENFLILRIQLLKHTRGKQHPQGSLIQIVRVAVFDIVIARQSNYRTGICLVCMDLTLNQLVCGPRGSFDKEEIPSI
jgi:hypothetical protein